MFHLKHDDILHILLYQNLMSKGTDEVKEIKWSEWCEFLTRPVIHSRDKYANKLAIYGDISEGVDEKTGEVLHHRRKNEYVMYRQVFSLDYDDIDDMKRFIKVIQEKLNWIYVKNTDTVKREFYRASLACLTIHVLSKS